MPGSERDLLFNSLLQFSCCDGLQDTNVFLLLKFDSWNYNNFNPIFIPLCNFWGGRSYAWGGVFKFHEGVFHNFSYSSSFVLQPQSSLCFLPYSLLKILTGFIFERAQLALPNLKAFLSSRISLFEGFFCWYLLSEILSLDALFILSSDLWGTLVSFYMSGACWFLVPWIFHWLRDSSFMFGR